jgi:AraC family transcriptional regulator, regulatory protein of adaptative response / methylated-DNA-[protein]-cysteine methyltransferase
MRTRTSIPSAPLVLHYTLRRSKLGEVLVAATPKGIAAVLLGDSKSALIDDLQLRYPQAQLDTGGPLLHRWSDTVLEILEHPRLQHVVPLDAVSGTDFQRKVWKALRGIPAGQTRTYTEVAHAIGQPQAVRAVASACAANPLAVLVPCHRVLRSDGGWGGYRWGIERKQQLLQQEGAISK